MQFGQMSLYDAPDNLVIHFVIAVHQDVAEINNHAVRWYAHNHLRRQPGQLADRLTYDLELSLYRRTAICVTSVSLIILACRKLANSLASHLNVV